MVWLSFVRRAPAGAAVWLAVALSLPVGCVPPQVHERIVPEVEGPASIPGFVRIRTIEFPQRADGWLYSYRGAGLRPDVYIYPAATAGTLGAAHLTRLESSTLKRTFPARQRQGWIGSYVVQRDETVVLDIDGRTVQGHRLTALMRYADEDVVTHQYLFLWGSHFVKIRESHTLGAVAEEEVERFARLLLTALAQSPLSAELTADSFGPAEPPNPAP